MRLVQIKLAGFKSFVDPTSITVPGNLVGVVGPNGCGKSNIIDAVRWVLGESRASALRGDSMQDVIFNGSSKRSPVARASVELLFDNSLGRAAGQWSQYAEVSVKRVLERNGESSYFINNVHVRRRDVHDIFLGTGLGARAYAIIEQGMISRIIEAKPEELRVFLEEAAGVSKYKERRRETENRLSDTRENLARVDDIRQELGTQIEKLAQQAEVAGKFKQLSDERALKQGQLWLIRKGEATAELERTSREIEESTKSVESATVALRDTERRLDSVREQHYVASDASSEAQNALFEVNSEINRLEAEIRSIVERRAILSQSKSDQERSLAAAQQKLQELDDARTLWESNLDKSGIRMRETESALHKERARLPDAENAWRVRRDALIKTRDEVAQASQALSLAQAGLDHAGRTLSALGARLERCQTERDSLVPPDTAVGSQILSDLGVLEAKLSNAESRLKELEAERSLTVSTRSIKDADVRRLERELASLDAQLSTLRSIQGTIGDDAQAQEWLQTRTLSARPRLWQRIAVRPGWELAFESALGEKLHSIEVDSADSLAAMLDERPPVRLGAYVRTDEPPLPAPGDNLPGTALLDLVTVHEAGLLPILSACLAFYRAIEVRPDIHARLSLDPRLILITPDGNQYSRYGVTVHAAGSSDGGVLERQREIGDLTRESVESQSRLNFLRRELAELDVHLSNLEYDQVQARKALDEHRNRIHKLRMADAEYRQSVARYSEKMEALSKSISEIAADMESEQLARSVAEGEVSLHQSALVDARSALELASNELSQSEAALANQRDAVMIAERSLQEARLSHRECELKLDEIRRMLDSTNVQVDASEESIRAISRELSELNDQPIRGMLESALTRKSINEKQLAERRNIQEELGIAMKALEAERIENASRIEPLRERISELKLKEQAAQLAVQQFSTLLADAKIDENLVSSTLKEGQRPAPLQTEINRITAAIAELGPVNMAALGELETCRERKDFLDSQAADLDQALETLESAIKKIDRETRDLLQSTFDKVNYQFGLMFPALFGGGEARLVMTGEEVLDSGVQVMARPPGKKNSTIHLLSGGEKALTAISLVFSMFQLNPAPFCLLDEVDAPLDDANTIRFCDLVRRMAQQTQFLFISHNKLTMEIAHQLIGVTMQEQGVSRVVAVDIDEAMKMREPIAA